MPLDTSLRCPCPRNRRAPRGLTIFELLIAITISLILLAVMIQAFQRASSEISKGRATMELAAQLRSVGELMRRDLGNATVSTRMWAPTSECNGYFEVVEGIRNDNTSLLLDPFPGILPPSTLGTTDDYVGDYDDVLALTVRSDGRPFRGRWVDGTGNTQMVESNMAEVIWFVVHEDIDDTDFYVDRDDRVRLYRRVLLIRPDLTLTAPGTIDEFFRLNDISAHPQGGTMVANSLDELTRRENRYCHNQTAYPFVMEKGWLESRRLHQLPGEPANAPILARLNGEDIVLSDVCGFDLRVYSPNAPIISDGQFVIEPGDANFLPGNYPNRIGGYVDLGFEQTNGIDDDADGSIDEFANGADDDGNGFVDDGTENELHCWFASGPNGKSGLSPPLNFSLVRDPTWVNSRTWDSWSAHYYATYRIINGLDDDGDSQIDELDELVLARLNGLDDDSDGQVDEEDELEVAPPYPFPIRGLRVTFKAIEKNTSSVRQLTITSGFVPE